MIKIPNIPTGRVVLLVIFGSALLTGGCSHGPSPVWTLDYFQDLKSETVENEILFYETEIIKHPDNPVKAAPYYYLALLHAHYNNPAPDYERSLAMCDKYLALNPVGYKKNEALYLKDLLEKLARAQTERGRYREEAQEFKQAAQKVQEHNQQLIQKNHELKDAIEKLEMLDLRLEEQRRDL